MQVGLFIPCYIDQLFPHVGMATVEVLERFGAAGQIELDFPSAQTCCGQPMANTGCNDQARPLARRFVDIFRPYDYVVCPSASCVAMVRHHFHSLFEERSSPPHELDQVIAKTFELCEFLIDVLNVQEIGGQFAHRVGLHQSCHGLRELRMGSSSEIIGPAFNKPRQLLESIDEIELINLNRPDECCGFGGTFAVGEEAVSCMMGMDRLADHQQAGAEIITAVDMSCLMHLDGLTRRHQKPLKVMHIAEVIADSFK